MTTDELGIPKLFDDDDLPWAWNELMEMTQQLRRLAESHGLDGNYLVTRRSLGEALRVLAEDGARTAVRRRRELGLPPVENREPLSPIPDIPSEVATQILAEYADAIIGSAPFKRYIHAVIYIALNQSFRFVYGDGKLMTPYEGWGEFIRGPIFREWGSSICNSLTAILTRAIEPPHEGEEATLRRFIRDVLCFKSAELVNLYMVPVAHILWDGRWRTSSNGDALAYVREAARRRVAVGEDERILHPESADIMNQRAGRPWVDSLDASARGEPTNDPIQALIPDARATDEIEDVVNRIAIQQVLDHSGLPPGTTAYALKQYEAKLARQQAADFFGWPKRRVDTIERTLERRHDRLKNEFSA